ncbi:MAG TPA: hypothetical protein VGB18_08355 [Candidatus Thermoplasmatota archaeon]
MQPTARTATELFQEEYDRINQGIVAGSLPPFPGVELVDRTDIFSLTRG